MNIVACLVKMNVQVSLHKLTWRVKMMVAVNENDDGDTVVDRGSQIDLRREDHAMSR